MKEFKRVEDFSTFLSKLRLNEVLSVNKEVEELSDYLHTYLNDKPIGIYVIDNIHIPEPLSIKKLTIEIYEDDKQHIWGFTNVTKSTLDLNGLWEFTINLKPKPKLGTIYHEVNHLLQQKQTSKDTVIKKANYLSSKNKNYSLYNEQFTLFFEYLYFSADTEIDSKVIETYGYLKSLIGTSVITNSTYFHLLTDSSGWVISEMLINYKTSEIFKNVQQDDINLFFNIIDTNRKNMDYVQTNNKHGFFSKFIKSIKVMYNTKEINKTDKKSDKDDNYYEKFIIEQGYKLRHKIMKLSGHFKTTGTSFLDSNI